MVFTSFPDVAVEFTVCYIVYEYPWAYIPGSTYYMSKVGFEHPTSEKCESSI